MKKIIGLFIVLLSAFVSKAQAPDFDDLKILYADANYEKLVKVAEGYTLKDDLKKDPLPFIWLGKGLYKISLSGTDDEKYKNAFKDAIAAVGKAMKNDKEHTELSEFQDFIDEFQNAVVELINNDIGAKDYSKASGWVIKYYKITNNPIGAKYLDGATKYRKADKGGANTLWKEADLLLSKTTSIENWSEADKTMLKLGIFQTAECYIASKQLEKAKSVLNKIAPWFEDDEDFKTKYDEIIN